MGISLLDLMVAYAGTSYKTTERRHLSLAIHASGAVAAEGQFHIDRPDLKPTVSRLPLHDFPFC
jgi:hypothetical protein